MSRPSKPDLSMSYDDKFIRINVYFHDKLIVYFICKPHVCAGKQITILAFMDNKSLSIQYDLNCRMIIRFSQFINGCKSQHPFNLDNNCTIDAEWIDTVFDEKFQGEIHIVDEVLLKKVSTPY